MQESLDNTFEIYICSYKTDITKRLKEVLNAAGYHVSDFRTPSKALDAIKKGPVDLLILTDGKYELEVLTEVKRNRALSSIPVLVVTSDLQQKKSEFYVMADDILDRDFVPMMVRIKVQSILQRSETLQRMHSELELLEMKVHKRTNQLQELNLAIVAALERASELNDRETGNHILRVGRYSEIIAEAMGMEPEYLGKIRLYAPLHDVGKVAIPDAILQKKAPLTPEEFEIMKKHTLYGYELLAVAKAEDIAKNIALSHHERVDGSGYPFGLKGAAIPLEARIVALADVFDAITTKRPYKKAMSFDDAVQYIEKDSRHLFDPDAVEALVSCHKEILEVFQSLSGPDAFLRP